MLRTLQKNIFQNNFDKNETKIVQETVTSIIIEKMSGHFGEQLPTKEIREERYARFLRGWGGVKQGPWTCRAKSTLVHSLTASKFDEFIKRLEHARTSGPVEAARSTRTYLYCNEGIIYRQHPIFS